MPRWIVLLVTLVVAIATAAMPAAAQYKPEFKQSLVVGPSGPWGEGAARFADLVRERTQGRINIKNYFAGQLFAGKQTNEFTLLNQGVADFAFGSTINWSPQVKELNLFAMPFMFPSYRALDAVTPASRARSSSSSSRRRGSSRSRGRRTGSASSRTRSVR
jgi:TRAP-type C4-dicarboxylate transport system substrate-binding protein